MTRIRIRRVLVELPEVQESQDLLPNTELIDEYFEPDRRLLRVRGNLQITCVEIGAQLIKPSRAALREEQDGRLDAVFQNTIYRAVRMNPEIRDVGVPRKVLALHYLHTNVPR